MLLIMVTFHLVILFLLLVSYLRIILKYFEKARVCTSDSAITSKKSKKTFEKFSQAPGPFPLPIVGNLNMLQGYKAPFQAFSELSKKYGDAFSLSLGSTRCLVVNSLGLIREVLNQNGKFFGGRPDFLRYHKLFGGDRNNSLALCDWSYLQQKRRNLARRHCSPKESTSYFTKMSHIGCQEINELMDKLRDDGIFGEPIQLKPIIQQTCANMFTQYMCSIRFEYDDSDFKTIVEYFDEIFWEINQGYALDFLPWLAPFYKKHIKKIINWSMTIRKFILKRIIRNREQYLDLDEPENDFTDALLKSLVEDKNVSRDTIIFMLEDFIGGHSAVGNLVMLALAYMAKHPQIATRIQAEADYISDKGQRIINLYDMDVMPYTVATIFEVLRYSSSPIVPHVATQDTIISGHGVTAGTIVFINNFKLNSSALYWKQPNLFDPERFLDTISVESHPRNILSKRDIICCNYEGYDSGVEFDSNTTSAVSISAPNNIIVNYKSHGVYNKTKYQIKKNIPHFLPFSVGKRTCIGQNLVRGFSFILLANILQQYNVSTDDVAQIKINPACVALPAKTFPLILRKRPSINK